MEIPNGFPKQSAKWDQSPKLDKSKQMLLEQRLGPRNRQKNQTSGLNYVRELLQIQDKRKEKEEHILVFVCMIKI